ncbi:hypothetical protein CPT_Maine_219 [Staphylococcus phage Maine]|nr:hypothetical protein C5023_000219 [Staphylococcus phage vB_SauM_0414_108]QEM41465.1 hypothetical protein CPT_Maine_219 [Staphylococcus phage Maine]
MKTLQVDNTKYEVDFVAKRPTHTTVMIYLKDDSWVEISKTDYKNNKTLKISSKQILSKSN